MTPLFLISSNQNIGFVYLYQCVLIDYSLSWQSSTRDNVLPKGVLAMSEDIFHCHWVRKRMLLAARGADKNPTV